jgi:tRNA(Ile)-lysidine synthase
MREGSGDDARWVRGLCRAWAVPLILGQASMPPRGEEEARRMRYDFLFRAREEAGARWLLTAHHADDQAETVLFRALRGTGLRGLAGIPRRRRPGIFRPLLPFPREGLEAYARSRGIRPREDTSNEDISIPRNYLRHVGLPALERVVAPGARKSLLRLARLARENEEAWDTLIPGLLEGLVKVEDRGVFVVRSAFLAYHPSLRGRLLREVLRRRGLNLDEAGTRALLEFTRTGASGRAYPLPGGYRFFREFDRFLLSEDAEPGEDRPLLLPGPEEGSGQVTLGGRTYRVSWGRSAPETKFRAALSGSGLAFPLRVRGWAPGDRVHLPAGTRKLKRIFRDAGIPAGERNRIPVLVDASGEVLWVAGVAVSDRAGPKTAEAPFFVGMEDVHQS